jgi:hypothetical protein
LPLSSTDQPNVTSIVIHDKDLIALKSISGGLKDQFLPVKGEVGFRILPPKRELPKVGQTFLLGK